MQTVLFIEPLPLIRHSICAILSEGNPDYQVLDVDMPGAAPDASYPETADLIIVSVGAVHRQTEIIEWIQAHYPAAPPILLIVDSQNPPSSETLPPTVTCVSHKITPKVLRALINLLLAGGTRHQLHSWLFHSAAATAQSPPHAMKPATAPDDESQLLGLTPRQYEVLVLLSKGYPIKTVGRAMNISAATAKAHAEALYQRLDVNSRNAAVYKAILRGATLGWTMDKMRSMVDKHPGRRESAQAPWDATLRPGDRQSADDEDPDSERQRHSRTPHAA